MEKDDSKDISPNKAVFTTKHVMQHNSPITYIAHDHEDDWQFFGNEDVKDEDVMIVSINQILQVDSSVSDILNMPIGMEAVRNSKNEPFKKNKL